MSRLHREMMRVLVTEIVTGERAPGDALPREVELAQSFNVSRGVTRECIRAMEDRGLISVRHGRGATVNAESRWKVLDADVLGAMLATSRRIEILGQYVETRRLLEVGIAGMAAERADDADVAALTAALGQMEHAVGRPPSPAAEELFHQSDVAFHQVLARTSRNNALTEIVSAIHDALLTARYALARPEYRNSRALPEHRRILEAVARGDADEARQAMDDHLATVASYLAADQATLSPAPVDDRVDRAVVE